jgi:hypothetical protein
MYQIWLKLSITTSYTSSTPTFRALKGLPPGSSISRWRSLHIARRQNWCPGASLRLWRMTRSCLPDSAGRRIERERLGERICWRWMKGNFKAVKSVRAPLSEWIRSCSLSYVLVWLHCSSFHRPVHNVHSTREQIAFLSLLHRLACSVESPFPNLQDSNQSGGRPLPTLLHNLPLDVRIHSP